MADRKIYVYCELDGQDVFVGYLWSHIKGRNETTSFQYADSWLNNPKAFAIDPNLYLTQGTQYSNNPLFGVFTDCAPDRWGRVLMQRFEQTLAKEEKRSPKTLNEIDYMMLVNDDARQGALRLKDDPSGEFLFPVDIKPIPPLIKLPELLSASEKIIDNQETANDLKILLAPGSSLGGARPKASVVDNEGNLCIAKFPKKDDTGNVVLWEGVALTLAKEAGINTPEWSIKEILGKHVLIIKRFDRVKNKRIPFVSAMTMLSATDGDKNYSYQDIADVIRQNSSNPKVDMEELWKRIVFSVLISNTDDHLRNHGFLRLDNKGWRLSPVYDINPCLDNIGVLSTMIAQDDSSATLENALSIAEYLEITEEKANQIVEQIKASVIQWKQVAKRLGLSQAEINKMEPAFKI